MEGEFGICRGVGWCGWVLGGLKWPSGGFSHNRTSKGSLQENLQEATRDLQEVYKRCTGGLQEDAKSSFEGFEGVGVGGKDS